MMIYLRVHPIEPSTARNTVAGLTEGQRGPWVTGSFRHMIPDPHDLAESDEKSFVGSSLGGR